MLYSKTCEYAIRALMHLAQKPHGEFSTVQEIAQLESLPSYFLSKILQTLARCGLLDSAKGPTGGFSLARRKEDIAIMDIVAAIDGKAAYTRCAVGFMECAETTPCPMHETWSYIRRQITEYLETTTLEQITETLRYKREQTAALSTPPEAHEDSCLAK